MHPLVQEISYQDPILIFNHFAHKPWAMLLQSVQIGYELGRYSFIALEPIITFTSKDSLDNPLVKLDDLLKQFSLENLSNLPPFQGGIVGYFSYELAGYLEKLPIAKNNLHFPDMALGFYTLVVAFDHHLQQAWIFSSGEMAQARLQLLQDEIKKLEPLPQLVPTLISAYEIASNFTAETYRAAVQKVRDYIYAGDIFQANISQQFSVKLQSDFNKFNLYRRLALLNPAPFASYLNCGDTTIISASPERFLRLTNKQVETRPIKGTRPRGQTPVADQLLAAELKNSLKDQAENTMIVDLMRNDLSRVCLPHTVKVAQLCKLESFATVHHLVSVVTGELKKELNAIDLLCATFPGGSITGAPKIRAMEIIAEVEPTTRGPYCGCIGYIGFNGDMDTAITIRTYAIKNNILTFQAGGGIVADSDPTAEYEETLHKAAALKWALE